MEGNGRLSGLINPERTAAAPVDLTDEELILKFRTESGRVATEELFSEVFRRYYPRISVWCFRFTGDRNQTVDLAQEIFLKAYRHLDSYRGDSKFSTWLYAVTRNHCFNAMKQRANEPTESGEMIPMQMSDSGAMRAYTAIEERQSFRLMWQLAATTLDPLEARVMRMHYVQEMPLASITRLLSLSNPSGAKAYIVNARRKLNRALRGRG